MSISTARRLATTAWVVFVISNILVGGVIRGAEAQTIAADMREVTVAPTSFTRGGALPSWFYRQAKLPETNSTDPLIVRLADSHFRVSNPASVVVHRAIQVNDAALMQEVGQYPISFQPNFQSVDLHWLKVYRGTEIIDKLEGAAVRFYNSERSAEQGIYSGSITAVVITQDLRPGDTLEIIYSLVGQNPVYGGRYADAASWDSVTPVLKRRVTLDTPKGRTIRHQVISQKGNAVPSAVETNVGDRHLVRYESDNLPSIEQESLVPPDVQSMRWIQFSEFRDWHDVDEWASGLFDSRVTSSMVLPSEVGAAPTKAESVTRALQFVQDNIRYLSLSIGENSHRPYPPSEVLTRRYGDCKDKSFLLATMLRHLGIQAQPVLISTQLRKGLRDMLPSPLLFDHAIVRATVDGRVYFLDPTLQAQATSLEHLGRVFPGADVLIVGNDSRQLESIPITKADETPISHRTERVQVPQVDGPAEMQIEFSYGAEDAEGARRALARLSPAQIRKAYEGILDRRYPRAQLLADPQIRDDRQNNVVIIEARYRVPNFFENQGNKWSVRYEASNLVDTLPIPSSAKRRFPLLLPAYPWAGRYSIEINLPEDYDGRYRPDRRTLQAEAFQLDELLSFKGRQIRIDVDLNLKTDRIPAANTAQFFDDLRKANTFFRNSVFVSDQDRRVTASNLSLKDLSRQRLEQALQNTEKSIAAAKLGGRESATPRCEHALAAAYLEQLEVARKDADLAVNEQPTSGDVLRCRGTVRFVSGDFDASIRDLSRSLAMSGSEPEVYFHRGLAHYFAQHWALAADDFSIYGSRVSDEQAKARASVWLALTRIRVGQPLGQKGLVTAAWPAPVLGLFRGETSVEDLIEGLSRSENGSKLDEALAEGYFYFSQYLAATNRGKSQAFLKRAVELGPLYSIVQVAARHELLRLNSAAR